MLIFDLKKIGDNLRRYRKASGLTQSELAEAANLSDRSYTDIERGIANTRILTLLNICDVLDITPDLILTEESTSNDNLDIFLEKLSACNTKERATAIKIVEAYLKSR